MVKTLEISLAQFKTGHSNDRVERKGRCYMEHYYFRGTQQPDRNFLVDV